MRRLWSEIADAQRDFGVRSTRPFKLGLFAAVSQCGLCGAQRAGPSSEEEQEEKPRKREGVGKKFQRTLRTEPLEEL